MSLWIAALVAVGGIVAFFAWGNRKTAQVHARFGPGDVEDDLSELLDPGACCHDSWVRRPPARTSTTRVRDA